MGYEIFTKLLAPIRARVVNMVARAVLNLADDSKKMQVVQLQLGDDETREVERLQNYGFTSVPLKDAEAAVIFVGGRRDHGLAIAVDDRRYRIKDLVSGEVAIYTDQGDSIVIRRGGNITISGASKVVVDSPDVEIGQPASNPLAKGDTLNTAITQLGTDIASAVSSIPNGAPSGGAAAGAAITAAVGAFSASAAAALSTKAKVG